MYINRLNATANTQMADKIISLSFFNIEISYSSALNTRFVFLRYITDVQAWSLVHFSPSYFMSSPLLRCISTVAIQAESPLKLPAE